MKVSLLILFLTLLSTPALAGTESSSVYVFRVSQNTSASPGDFGHCTAVYDDSTKEIYTAAHCFHFMPLNLRGTNGELLLDLSNASYSFLENDIGLLDMLVITDFDDQLLESAKQDARVSVPSQGFSIVGFPAKFNTEGISRFYCDRRPIPGGYSPRAIEASLNSLHLNCETYTVGGSEKLLNDLHHKDVAGLSGGATFSDGRYIGVAYHYEVNDPVSPYFFKIQLFNSEDRPIEASQARRKYQLDTKLFEEAKLPNSVTSRLSLLLMVDFALPIRDIISLKDAFWRDANLLVLVTQDGKELEIPRRKLNSSLLAYFEQLL